MENKIIPGMALGWCSSNLSKLGELLENLAKDIGIPHINEMDSIPHQMQEFLFERAIDEAHEIDCSLAEHLSLDSDNFRFIYIPSKVNGFECFGLFVSKGDFNLEDTMELNELSYKVVESLIKNSKIESPLFFPAIVENMED